MIKIIPIALALMLGACGDAPQTEDQQRADRERTERASQKIRDRLAKTKEDHKHIRKENNQAYDAIESVCPGLEKHRVYLDFIEYDVKDYYEPHKFTFNYKVSEDFRAYWNAVGHNCSFSTNSDYSIVTIFKRGCTSICLDHESDESTTKLPVPKQ